MVNAFAFKGELTPRISNKVECLGQLTSPGEGLHDIKSEEGQ